MTWAAEDLLPLFDFPRENGTAGLDRAHTVLDSLLLHAQAPVQSDAFASAPSRLPVGGALLLLAAPALLWGTARPHPRAWVTCLAALALACSVSLGAFDTLLPQRAATNLWVTVPAAAQSRQTVLLTAHYDSKTEPFDHATRAAVAIAAVVLVPVALALQSRQRSPHWRWGLGVPAAVAAALLATTFLAAGVGSRSHGIRDNAAACALLLEICSRALHRPLQHTTLAFAWWSGEEIGAQGSHSWVHRHPRARPDAVLNLEAIGAGPDLAIADAEWTGRVLRRPHADLVARIAANHPRPLRHVRVPVLTDAGPFLGRGVPAVTLLNLPAQQRWPRGMHRPQDDLASLHAGGLEISRETLVNLLRSFDAAEANDASGTSPTP